MGALASVIPTLVDGVLNYFNSRFKNEQEKLKAKQELEKFFEVQLQQAWQNEQEELTKRLKIDMTSDNWLSKNIRPLVLIYLMALFTLAFFMKVPESTMELLKTLLLTAFSFYFGARTIEKIFRMIYVDRYTVVGNQSSQKEETPQLNPLP
jgi:hypothetical protein